MRHIAALALLALTSPSIAQEPVTPASVIAEAAPEEWVRIAPDDLLVMDLAPDAAGRPRQVVIQLMPPPFSQPWVENIRTLAAAHWWDGTSVYRVVDNWVAQWGGGEGEEFATRALPEGVSLVPADCYELDVLEVNCPIGNIDGMLEGLGALAEDTELGSDWRSEDPYSHWVDFQAGWPIALGQTPKTGEWSAWPIHCYAHVGVARDLAPDTGTGAELYAVIGHAPRQLDRNIAVVGRVIDGIEHLSTLPRGTGEAGVYESRAEDTPILSVRLASELADASAYEYLSTDSDSFARYVAVRANRQDAFYTVPAGGVDICNVQVPVREVVD